MRETGLSAWEDGESTQPLEGGVSNGETGEKVFSYAHGIESNPIQVQDAEMASSFLRFTECIVFFAKT